MYKKIFVAVDDSKPAKSAMLEAIKLAKSHNAKLRIAYIANMFLRAGEGIAVDFKKHEVAMRKQGESILKKMLALAKGKHVMAESHLVEITEYENHIAEKIIEEATEWKADLIVIGTHGRKGLERLLKGSIAETVVRLSKIPIHLAKVEDK